MTAPKLYSLKTTSAFSRAVLGGPVYLVRISRSGRETRWAADLAKALKVTAVERDALRAKWPRQTMGRWVRAAV